MDWETAQRDWPGLVVLVGLTYLGPDGAVQGVEQFYGQIVTVDPENGVELDLSGQNGGERYWLPPDLEAFEVASPGEYRLRASGEVVTDPDLLTQWTVRAPTDA